MVASESWNIQLEVRIICACCLVGNEYLIKKKKKIKKDWWVMALSTQYGIQRDRKDKSDGEFL